MKNAITKYRGLPKKELVLAYKKVSKELDRTQARALAAAEQMADAMEEHKPSNIKRLERMDEQIDCLQSELDAIGMLKTGRFC